MNFNNHSNLEGQHAFLGASKYHWINYSEDKVADAYSKFLAKILVVSVYTKINTTNNSIKIGNNSLIVIFHFLRFLID